VAETLTTVTNKVLYLLGDSDQDIWAATEVKQYIKEGYNLLIRTAKPLWAQTYLNDVAGTALATLPADCLLVDRVTWNWQRIRQLSARQLRGVDPRFQSSSGPVRAYTLENDGLDKLRKWLVPATTATEDQDDNNTRLEYFKRAATLGDASEFDLPDRCVKFLRFYAMSKCLGRKGKGQDPKMAKHYMARFETGVQRMVRRTSRLNAQRIGRFGGPAQPRSPITPPRLPWQFGKKVRFYR